MRLDIIILCFVAFALFSGCLDEGVLVETQVNATVYNNYTNITGGGVSFDGNPVDLNGSVLLNGTFSDLNSSKVNKSGDIMTGDLGFDTANVTNVSQINFSYTELTGISQLYFWINQTYQTAASFTGIPLTTSTPGDGVRVDFNLFPNTTMGGAATMGFFRGTNSSLARFIIFKGDGSSSQNIILGANTDSSFNKYVGNVTIGSASNPYGTLTINNLSGSGNDYACLDSTGKLFRSNTAC